MPRSPFHLTLRRALSVGAATIAVVSIAAVTPAAGASVAPAAKAVSTEPQLLDLLAGSASYLVYVEAGLLPAGGHVAGAPISSARTRLFARTPNGKVMRLGRPPAGLQPGMSISGTMLTGLAEKPDYSASTAHWWKLGTHRHGRFALPAGASYLTAAPDGAVLANGNQLLEVTTGGKVRSLGTPFPTAAYVRAVSDGHGLVAIGTSGGLSPVTTVAYMQFSDPGHFRPLDYTTTDSLWCPDVDKVVVGCHTENEDGGVLGTQLIPLDGSPATTTTQGGITLGLIGDTAIWPARRGLQSISLGDSTVKEGPASLTPVRYNRTISGTDAYPSIRQFGSLLVAALGKVAIVQDQSQKATLVSSVSRGHRLFSVPRSRAAVSAFALTTNRALYAGDARVAHHKGRFSTYSVAIRHQPRQASFAAPHLLHANSDYVLAGVSRQLQVYAVRAGQEHSDLKVVYRGQTRTIKRVPFDSYLSVSGTRVMYAERRLIAGGPTAVYNAASGKTKLIDTDAACCDEFEGAYGGRTPALSGSNVFYIKPDGSVWQHDLNGGKEEQLAAPRSHSLGGVVFAAAGRAAWTITTGSANHPATESYLRRLVPGAHNQKLPDRVIDISSAGVLTTDGTLQYKTGHIGPIGTYVLRRFNGTAHVALTKREVFVLPELAGHTMAWVDTAGRLHVKDL
jgi:hypothetical protein